MAGTSGRSRAEVTVLHTAARGLHKAEHEAHFFDRALETLDRESLRELQDQKFRRLLPQIAGAGFFSDKLHAAANGSAVQGLADLGKIPFTTKLELVEQQASFPPFGKLLTAPLWRYRYFHQTSGTSGNPLMWLDTQEDWETWIRCWNYVYRAAGVTEHDIVFLAYSFGPYVSHWAAMDGARRVGALTISGAGMNSLQRLQTMLARHATVVVCTPTYALRLAEVARENGLDLASSGVRVTIHAGEPGASVPHVRKAIQDAWGARCFDHAGATEVGAWAFECAAESGAIHLNEAEFIFEIIDPNTGQAVPDGQHGELVITGLTRTGMPALRYRTGDLVNPTYEPCPCGRTWARIKGGVIGRADDMLIVRGVNVYPSAIDNVVRSTSTIVEYEVEVRRLNGMDDLTLKVETAPGSTFENLQRSLTAAFRNSLNIRVSIEPAPAGSLPRYEMKARRYKRVP